jgi:hypothetical protein
MYLMYSDESNLEAQDNTFFIYGGIAVDTEKAKTLSDSVQRVRDESGIPSDFVLKFKPEPENMSHSDFNECKKEIIRKAIENECILLVSLIHHDIALNPQEARRNEINRVAFHYNCLLNRRQSSGLMLIDRFDDSQIDAQLREKFLIGLHGLPYSDPYKLDRVLGYHYSAKGQSNFGSAVDIIICSFRFAVNAYCRNEEPNLPTASRLLELLAPLFFREEGDSRVSELSLFFSPKIIRAPCYREEYENLKQFLSTNGIVAAQVITDQRLY